MSDNFFAINLRLTHAGGYGNIYLGNRTDNGKTVAIKAPREQTHWKEFKQQTRILARKIPGMVTLEAWNMNANPPWYAMQYFRRGTLCQYAGRLTDEQLLAVTKELAQYLSTIHFTVGTHGDIKPSNIFVTDDGHLRFGDPAGNGLALSMLVRQNQGGTPGYAAPEIIADQPMSRAADVYAFCATLYELLTGHVPQKGQRLDPTAEGYTRAPKICEIIAFGCQHDPKARPTIHEIIQMLNGATRENILEARAKTRKVTGGLVLGGLFLLVMCAFSE